MKNKLFITLIASVALIACRKDLIVENIEGKTLIINAPANNLTTSSNVVTFWWEELEGAEKYNLQIVAPTFTAISKLITDTNVTSNKFNFNLLPGNYQWRIKAINAGHSTTYQVFSLKIDSSNVLTNQFVIPTSPLSGYITKDQTVQFNWNELTAASSYSLEFKMNNTVINTTTTVNTNLQYTFPITAAGNYTCSWRVKALNATSLSQYNTAQTFIIDNLPPAVSTLTLPLNNAFVTDTVELVWNRPTGNDVKSDSIYVYTDATFLNLVKRSFSTTTKIKINQLDPSNPLPAGTGSLNATQYYWRVKSLDSLGNVSGFSGALGFKLHQ